MTDHTLYLSGPMAGLPEHNFPAFADATKRLRDAGYSVLSPHEIDSQPGKAWAEYLRVDLVEMLNGATALALLPGWENSRGANLERHVAEALGWPIKTVDFWLHAKAVWACQ